MTTHRSGPARLARRFLLVLAAAVLAAAGCRSRPGAGAFPVGLYGVRQPDDFPEVRAAGFNLVVGGASDAYLDAAHAAGLAVLASPGTLAGATPFDCPKARATIRRSDRHPAVWGWYLSDEPDLNRVPPDEVGRAHRCVKALGARKPTAIVLSNGNQAREYAGIADRLMMDRYPIPWMPLADFGKHLRLARLAAGRDRPMYAVIQAFDWATYPELLPRRQGLRAPTYEEMRAMTFLARVHGADGVFYYCFKDGRWDMHRHPATWEALRRVVDEVRLLDGLFRGAPQWRALGVHYPETDHALNEALDPAIGAAVVRVGDDDILEPGEYLVAVNSTAREVDWQFSWDPPAAEPLQVLTSGAWLEAEGGWFLDRFEPYGVRVYGPLP